MQSGDNTIRGFRDTLRRFERLISNQSKGCCPGISMPQCHILLEIDREKTATTSGLARSLNLDISTISRTVDSLVKSKLVERKENPEDRRSLALCLTGKGMAFVRTINTDADKYFADVIRRIPKENRDRVLKDFNILVRAFSQTELEEHESSSSCCTCKGK